MAQLNAQRESESTQPRLESTRWRVPATRAYGAQLVDIVAPTREPHTRNERRICRCLRACGMQIVFVRKLSISGGKRDSRNIFAAKSPQSCNHVRRVRYPDHVTPSRAPSSRATGRAIPRPRRYPAREEQALVDELADLSTRTAASTTYELARALRQEPTFCKGVSERTSTSQTVHTSNANAYVFAPPPAPSSESASAEGTTPTLTTPTSSCGSSGSPSASSLTPRNAHVGRCGVVGVCDAEGGLEEVGGGPGIAISTATRARGCSSSSPGCASTAFPFSAFAFALGGGCDATETETDGAEDAEEGRAGGGAGEGGGGGRVYDATKGCERTSEPRASAREGTKEEREGGGEGRRTGTGKQMRRGKRGGCSDEAGNGGQTPQ
ncbi:hypothetical protein DFH09DRAFT_1421889 [Mycena vulgaris]|nr:hypothetical protein DFH09DRAFT_1421889 [Mycena vulgaris]